MAWNDAPPTKEELAGTKDWAGKPPSQEELNSVPYTKLGSAGMGALNQFGLAPEVSGAAQHPIGALKALMGLLGKDESSDEDVQNYAKARDASQAGFTQAQKDNPGNYLAGNLVGGLIPAALTGGASEEGAAAQGLSKLLGGAVAPSTAASMVTGAGYGALGAAGSSNADLAKGQGSQLLTDALKGAGPGAVVGGVLGKVSQALSPEALDAASAKQAVGATSPTKAQVKNLMNAPSAEEGGNRLIEQGQNLQSKYVGPNGESVGPIVTPMAGGEKMLSRAQDLADKSGKHIGDILGELDNKFTLYDPAMEDNFVKPSDIASKIEDLQNQFVKNGKVVPLYEGEYNKLQKAIDTVTAYGNKPISFAEAQELKQLISKSAYNDKGQLEDQLMGQVRGIVNDSIEDSADKVAAASGDPDLNNNYLNAKEYYRTAKDAINSLQGKVAKTVTNRDLGITDYMSGGIGAALGGTPGGIVAAGLNKLGRSYGDSVAASALKTAANVSSAINKAFTAAPEAIGAIGKKLAGSGVAAEQRLGRVLVEASQKDDIGRNALIFSLMQNPAYRDMMAHIVSPKENK
jgi:hypothetical protein